MFRNLYLLILGIFCLYLSSHSLFAQLPKGPENNNRQIIPAISRKSKDKNKLNNKKQNPKKGNRDEDWHNHNDWLLPSEEQKAAIGKLDIDGDGIPNSEDEDIDGDGIPNSEDEDIDGDGVLNILDPAPFDWREIGYQPWAVLEFFTWNHDWNGYHYPNEKRINKAIDAMKRAGIGCVRIDFAWHQIEIEKGKYDFTRQDLIVRLLSGAGIRVLGVLSYCPEWEADSWNSPPRNLDKFAAFAKDMVSRYKNKIKYWEVWNEPNCGQYWSLQDDSKTYVKLLKKTYLTLKKEDPSCLVLLGGLCMSRIDETFIHIYEQGGGSFFDIANIHPFMSPRHPHAVAFVKNNISKIRKIMNKFGDQYKKIWLTELGCPGVPDDIIRYIMPWWLGDRINEEKQKEWVGKVYTEILQIEGVEKIFWAFFRDTFNWHNATDYMGLLDYALTPKPAYYEFMRHAQEWMEKYYK